MPVKMREEARLTLRGAKIDDQHAPLWFEDAADLACALLAHLARKVVEHERAQQYIELGGSERQCLGNRVLERYADSCLARL